jgi:hypothetical protein
MRVIRLIDTDNIPIYKLKKMTISLIDFDVRVITMAENADNQAYGHYEHKLDELIKDYDYLECTLDYPLSEAHTFQIPTKEEINDRVFVIGVDDICKAIALEYKKLWDANQDMFTLHGIDSIWIEMILLEGNKLIVYMGS